MEPRHRGLFHYDLGAQQSVVTDRRGGDRLIAYDESGRATPEAIASKQFDRLTLHANPG